MASIKRTEIFGSPEKVVLVDTAWIDGGYNCYEVIAMQKDGTEVDIFHTLDRQEAEKVHDNFVKKYSPREQREQCSDLPLAGKYAKLRDDLKAAFVAGKAAADKVDDGGTCNFDSPSLRLPRWNRKQVEQAAKEAGSLCMGWKIFGCKRYLFPVPTNGQGRKREVAAEAATAYLEKLGYDTICYQQID